MSNPALADIASVGTNPSWGSSPAPGAGGGALGINGPRLPGVEWAPKGGAPGWQAMMAAMAAGIPPISHGHIQLKSHDFMSKQYSSPPWSDSRDQFIMPDMLCFTVRVHMAQNDGPDDVMVVTLANLNSILDSEDRDFREAATATGSRDARFLGYLLNYGEKALETYHKLETSERRAAFAAMVGKRVTGTGNTPATDLEEFYKMATEDHYCWLTTFGILSRINFAGTVLNVNRGTSLEGYMNFNNRERYTQVVVGTAKRLRVANIFGERDQVETDSKLWLMLRRKPSYRGIADEPGAYCVYPGASVWNWPTAEGRAFHDLGGRRMVGHVWPVGTVYTPPVTWSSLSACRRAANCEVGRSDERSAYEFHATMPTMYVLVGFNN